MTSLPEFDKRLKEVRRRLCRERRWRLRFALMILVTVLIQEYVLWRQVHSVFAPDWMSLGVGGALNISVLFWFAFWSDRQVKRHLLLLLICPKCHYDLTGNESGVCPECGTEVKA